jgi:UDP-N-acetylmuramoylalanine--D-glutamate ligase
MTKKYAVFGLGKSGLASLAYLGDKVAYCWDDNSHHPSHLTLHPNQWDWKKIEALILAPGIPLTHPQPHYIVEAAHVHKTPIICDVEILWQDNRQAKFIGITGTNGKSTTTALLAHVLAENAFDVAVGGNLGQAALTLGKHKYYVIEMSSYQLDLIDKTRFDIAIWLNTTPDHLDRHGDMAGYIAAKSRIFRNGNDVAIIGVDDENGRKMAAANAHAIPISREDNLGVFTNLPGKHNMQNISAVTAACKALNIAEDKIFASIRSFPGLAHRLEFVAEKNGVKFINDSKATNAESTACALQAFDEIHWLAGGVPKDGGINSLTEFFPKIRKVYLFGQAAEEFAQTLQGKVDFEIYPNLQAVTNAAYLSTIHNPESTILLSPACASFDQFNNFEHRGDEFKKFVQELLASNNSTA